MRAMKKGKTQSKAVCSTWNTPQNEAEVLRLLREAWPREWTGAELGRRDWPELDKEAEKRLGAYVRELWRWNERLNLSRLVSPAEMAYQNLLDSALGLVALAEGEEVADVGSGAGFPGLVLAILDPASRYTLFDARAKRIEFLNFVIRSLKLGNVRAEHAVWPLAANETRRFSTILSRATFSEVDTLLTSGTMLAPGGRFLLWRSQTLRVDSPLSAREAVYALPGLSESRRFVSVEKDVSNG